MSLYLSNKEKLELLKTQKLKIFKNTLLKYLNKIKKNTLKLIENLSISKNLISKAQIELLRN